MNTPANTRAPLYARRQIVIAAPLDRVWDLQTTINAWPTWQRDITTAKLEGPLAAGSTFRWQAKGLNITSQLHTVEPRHLIGWTGVSLGMAAIHNWTFEAQGTGTLVTTEESLSGWLTRLLKLSDAQFLEKSLQASLALLKAQAEHS